MNHELITEALAIQQAEWEAYKEPVWGVDNTWVFSLAPAVMCELTKGQRNAIIKRDEGTSQMRHYSEEKGWHTGGYCEDGGEDCTDLHVHHVIPQREGGTDEPENLITLFACEHIGYCKKGCIREEIAK